MAASKTQRMAEEGRALLTEAERQILTGERDVSDNYEYKIKSLVRTRVRRQFGEDVAVLRENFPEAYQAIWEVVCDE